MMERGDKYFMAVCNKTGMIAVYNPDKNLFLSPMADGPLKFVGSLAENNMKVEKISQHGREFSVVRIPYSLKLLIQELQTLNVTMRLITDDNIEQIENLSFSKNMNILLDKKGEITMKEYITDLTNKILRSKRKQVDYVEEEAFIQEDSPLFTPESRAYAPGSPAYAPGSPVYNPDSPPYAPGSPAYTPDDLPEFILSNKKEYSGGGSKNNFNIGDVVSLNSYRGQNNIWVIESIGDEFITIVRYGSGEIYGGGSKKPEDIQIVQPFDISFMTPIQHPQQQPFMPDPGYFLQGQPQPEKTTPDFNIVLVNGDGNKLDGASTVTQSKPKEVLIQETLKDKKIGGGSDETNKEEEIKGGESFWDNMLKNTSNLFVKKV